MNSTDSIDRRWQKTIERRIKQEKVLEMMKEKETSMLSSLESDKNIEILTEDEIDSDLFEDNQPLSLTQFRKRKVNLLISKYHCSKMQAVAGIIETGKLRFNRKYWKFHTEDTTCLDLYT